MYEAFFGMEHTPFVRDVPPEKLYESSAFRETLGRLSYVADRQMFAVVTADSGCGKSTLIRRFYSELPKEDYIVLYLSDSKLTPRWFYKGLLDQLGLESRFYRGDSKRQLQQEIEIIRGVQHKKVVCILDEAHLLEKETLEEFRFLLNYKFDSVSSPCRSDRTFGKQTEVTALRCYSPENRYVLHASASGQIGNGTIHRKSYGVFRMSSGGFY